MSQTFQSEKHLYDDKSTTFYQLFKILMVENKSIQMIEELKDILRQFIYFQTLFHFISNVFPCFNFINTFIQLFEVVSEDELNTDKNADFIVRICLESFSFSQVQENSFLEQYNWGQFAKKCRIIQNQAKSLTKIEGEIDKEQLIKNEQCQQYKYLLIQQSKFIVCLKKYQNQRDITYNNIIKCIPQVQQITSKRTQDNIIKSIESINLFENTVITLQQDQFVTPRKSKLQKFKKDALWFLISGNGVVEQRISETVTVPISTISEGSLFGEEILFQNLKNEQDDNDINSSLENIKQFKEQINEDQGRFQLRITSKLGKMYCIQKEQILLILPSKIVKEIQTNFIQKFNNRKNILTSQLECQKQQNIQVSERKKNIRRQFSEILNTNNIQIKQTNQRESFMDNQEDLIMQRVIDKKQMILKLQENQLAKKVLFADSSHSPQRDSVLQFNDNSKTERKSSKEIKKKPNIQLVLKEKKSNDKTNQSSLNEQQKFFSVENEQNINSSYKTLLSSKPTVEKRYLNKKIFNIINQGFDFGTKDKQSEYNKEHAIKMLQLKNGIINPITKARHPSIYEHQEKMILKQQQKIQSISIARLLDNTPSQQSIYNQFTNQENNQINITSLQNIEDRKQSFYLTPKEFCQSARQLEQKFQASFQNTSSKLLRYNTVDISKMGTTQDFTPFQNKTNKNKSSNSIKRPSDQSKSDEMSLIQFGLNLIQIPNNEINEKNKSSILINKTLNSSSFSDNNKQKSFTGYNQNNQRDSINFKSDEIGNRGEFLQNKESSFADFINNTNRKKSRCFSNFIQANNFTEEENSMSQANVNYQSQKKLLRQRTCNSINELLDLSQIGSKKNNNLSQNNQSLKQINSIFSELNSKNFIKKDINYNSQKSQDNIFNQICKSNQQSARKTTKISLLLEENERIKSARNQISLDKTNKQYNNAFASVNINKILSKSPSFDQINFIQGNIQHKNKFSDKDQQNLYYMKNQENQQCQASRIDQIGSPVKNSTTFNLEKTNENSFNLKGQKISFQEKYIKIKSNKGEYIRLNNQINQIDNNQNSNQANQDQFQVSDSKIHPRDRKLLNQYNSSPKNEKQISQIIQNKELVNNIRLRSSQQFYKSPKKSYQKQISDQKLKVNTDSSSVMKLKKSNNQQLQRCLTQDQLQEITTDFYSQAQGVSSNELSNQQNIEDQNQQIFEADTFGIQNMKNLNQQVNAESCNNYNNFASSNNIDILNLRQNELTSQEKLQQQEYNYQNQFNQKFNFKSYLLQKAKNNQAIKRKNVNIQKDFEQPNLLLCNKQIQILELKKS
ncbi:hypothetical protein TTHERM_00463300 (macronuclear) [Tetrahymena thermophila SB210]|uniref:Cyclic nucleotide-binding domain-containing protein n=1 Tax=Tetrahymena thermophila (strain SB210) TaxID=312017 RepID=Q23PV3_TETTS|nr:hypothetical protein TTHERM_00463300 [Tetrahymena thermophila SB210]EAR98582.2 hypothetical protein TTHERM_00463300 [Tetrahymena thermophila SB210]|eukprot:XP_001018827.2 hypothetical protein TTHERM_00463300 [Tetrahymena thermophila SB210]